MQHCCGASSGHVLQHAFLHGLVRRWQSLTPCRQGLEQLYAAGARKFMVASIAALDLVPASVNAAQQVAALNKAYTGIASTPIIEYFVALTVQLSSLRHT